MNPSQCFLHLALSAVCFCAPGMNPLQCFLHLALSAVCFCATRDELIAMFPAFGIVSCLFLCHQGWTHCSVSYIWHCQLSVSVPPGMNPSQCFLHLALSAVCFCATRDEPIAAFPTFGIVSCLFLCHQGWTHRDVFYIWLCQCHKGWNLNRVS